MSERCHGCEPASRLRVTPSIGRAASVGRVSCILALMAVALFQPVGSGAQTPATCAQRAARPFIGFAFVNHTLPGTDLDQSLSAVPFQPFELRDEGAGVAVDIGVPLRGVWSVRVLGSHLPTSVFQGESRVGTFYSRRLHVGILRHVSVGRCVCRFSGFTAGIYQFRYGEVKTHVFGGSAFGGFEVPVFWREAIVAEFDINVVPPNTRPPLAWETFMVAGFFAGLRHRF